MFVMLNYFAAESWGYASLKSWMITVSAENTNIVRNYNSSSTLGKHEWKSARLSIIKIRLSSGEKERERKHIPQDEMPSPYSGSCQLDLWSRAEHLALCFQMQSLHRLWHQLMSQLTEFSPNICYGETNHCKKCCTIANRANEREWFITHKLWTS